MIKEEVGPLMRPS